jgi:hypothetical protein
MKAKTRGAVSAILFCCLLSWTPLSAEAFDMTEYWPAAAGTVWILDHEILILGAKTHQFSLFEGKQLILASSYCQGICGQHAYLYSGPEGLLGVGLYENENMVDLSATPLKIAAGQMVIGQTVVTNIPAGVLDEDAFRFTVTLLAQEAVTVPAGTFDDTLVLQLRVDDDPESHYIEKLWLAKNVGPVKIERVSEFPENHEGCFLTCGCYDRETGEIVHRVISLEDVIGPPLIDINNNGKLGLEEVIYTLQVLSGSR